MAQTRSIAYSAPRTSQGVNDRLLNVMGAAATKGFNLGPTVPASMNVVLQNRDEAGEANTLITPEGVVIHESDNIVATLALTMSPIAIVTNYILCRYNHDVSVDPSDPATYVVETNPAAILTTDTLLGIVIVPMGAVNVTLAEMFEPPRIRNGGAEFPISLIVGAECVRRETSLNWSQIHTVHAAALGGNFIWRNAQNDVLYGSFVLPEEFSAAIKSIDDPATTSECKIKAMAACANVGVNGNAYFEWNFFWLRVGSALAATQVFQTVDCTGLLAFEVMEFEQDVPAALIGPGRQFAFTLTRRGAHGNDTYGGDLQPSEGILMHAINRIGGLYD